MSERIIPLAQGAEWGTFALILGCHALWAAALFLLPGAGLGWAYAALTIAIVLQSSLTHEVLHGHPFRSKPLNEALMFLPLGLFIPYGRFRDTHLAHHEDERLTDPYDDPESNFQDPAVWAAMPRWQQRLMRFNNTLLGRMAAGPAIGQLCFMKGDWAAIRRGDRAILRDWLLHLTGLVPVLWGVAVSGLPLWLYVLAAYAGLSVLKIRTFLEHRAHEDMHARTVIVEDKGPLAFLFLFNNLHIVHHRHPGVAWYRLPVLYRAYREGFQSENQAYVYRSYGQIFRQYFLRAKDPVPHPLWQQGE